MSTPVIVESKRIPAGKKDEALEDVRPDVLGAYLVREIVDTVGLADNEIDDVIFGCVDQVGEQAMNIARNVLLSSGLPKEIPATTVDRQCGSSQTALNMAAAKVRAGVNDVVLSGGVESMTRVPMGGNIDVHGDPFGPFWKDQYDAVPQGISAEMIADQWDISRDALDDFSYECHVRAGKAIEEGRFDRELVPVPVDELAEAESIDDVPGHRNSNGEWMTDDEGVRLEPDRDAMADLDPVFKEDGVVTAGNSSQMSDGASAVLVMSEEKANALGYEPQAKIIDQDVVGVDPTMMLTGPIPATQSILEENNLSVDDIDAFEVNEAFASVVLAWRQELDPDMDKVNINGGAIALGHPLGATGGKLMTTLVHELERRGERLGLQTMCCGGGLGTATLIDRDV
ncbi:MAG: acetyl-CoA C-acyltransferase [bacterium]